jgi:4a-hydroxytetrahydrobiopterin dehydratase
VVKRLTRAKIESELKDLDGWKLDRDFITKTFEFKTFMAGIKFVSDVARIAEEEEHHPDMHIRYTTITLSIQTHSEGGVTEWDLGLARRIENFLHQNPVTMH